MSNQRHKLLGQRPNAGPTLVFGIDQGFDRTAFDVRLPSDREMEQMRLAGRFICRCPRPQIEALGGCWGELGAQMCARCGRPPQESLT
ncbi:MAG TPA: hypothetical protein VFX15_00305 [Actinomycetes bacterium]|nr:hypothetical protein [Actinomycetes bacterium]